MAATVQPEVALSSRFRELCVAWNARRADNLFGMFTCYFDEAGGADHGFIAVCGWVAPVERWQRFEDDWRRMLTAYDLPYFHMAEYAHFRGPFAKWLASNRDERTAFIKDAVRIICECVQFGAVCVVHYDAFRKVDAEFELREHVRTPYALAGRFCIARANEWVKKQGFSLRDIGAYYFEDGGPDIGGLVEVTRRDGLRIPSFAASSDTEDESGLLPLQAADFLAYEMRKAVMDHRDPMTKPEFFRKSFQAFFGCEVEQGNYREEMLRNLCDGRKIPPRIA